VLKQKTMSKPELLVIGPYPDWDMAALEESFAVHRLWEAADRASFLTQQADKIQAIATRGDLGASAELMSQLPNLQIVSVFGVGTDSVDLTYARSRKILVTNTPDVLTGDVADLGMALLLAAARLLPQGDALVRGGAWPKGGLPLTTRVFGKKIGIVGMGRIGQAFAKRAAGFDCEISYFSRSARADVPYRFFPGLLDLAQNVEFLVVTLAGGEGTKNIINANVLKALGPEGVLVNISRGTTVDEEALLAALENRAIKAAGLDVFWNEPDINPRFLSLDNAILHPHHASGTVETRRAMGQLVRDNLTAHFSGKPLLTPVV
jgi:lactate dehydrogenase-like 2-hydroxyacid dehydrogenase